MSLVFPCTLKVHTSDSAATARPQSEKKGIINMLKQGFCKGVEAQMGSEGVRTPFTAALGLRVCVREVLGRVGRRLLATGN